MAPPAVKTNKEDIMNKNAFTTIVGILLILYALTNFGASMGQFAKGKTVSSTASMAVSVGNTTGNQADASRIQKQGAQASTILYAIALLILFTAIMDIAAAIGLFSGKNWAFAVVVTAAICGILVEIQDTAEDGFGIGKFIFFAINALALIVAFSAKKDPVF